MSSDTKLLNESAHVVTHEIKETRLLNLKIYSKKMCDCVPFYSIRDKSTTIFWSRL